MTKHRNSRLVFGFAIDTDIDLGVELPMVSRRPDLRLRLHCIDELPPRNTGLVYASEPEEGSNAGVTAYRGIDGSIIRFRSVSEFVLGADQIDCSLVSTDYSYLVPVQFLGIVMAMWMELRGLPVLHASGVAADADAVAFLAAKRGGKTSLAAAMARGGRHRLLSDDLVALDVTGKAVLARPSYPQLRMEPDVADHFIDGWERLPIVHPDHEKRRVPLSHLGTSLAERAPLTRIYLPERIDDGPVEITHIPGATALIELVRGSFVPRMVAGFGLEAKRFGKLGVVASTVPCRRLRYPSGLDHLPDVVTAVQRDLRQHTDHKTSQEKLPG